MNFRSPFLFFASTIVASVAALALAMPPRAGDTGYPPWAAPDFQGISTWLNSKPLSAAQLRGSVVLVDFWTYTCINCLNHLPYVSSWHEKYKDKGLVVVGVHTPEYAFEKSTANVREAISKLGIRHAVAQDNDYATWRAYRNRYWPAVYLVDRRGQVVYSHFGEGSYAATERKIQELLAEKPAAGS